MDIEHKTEISITLHSIIDEDDKETFTREYKKGK